MSVTKVINPFNGEIIGEVADFNQKQVKEAITRVSKVKGKMATMTAHRRASILYRIAMLIQENATEIAQLMAQESGKPMKYARGEVNRAVETFTFASEEARRINGETIQMDAAKGGINKFGYYLRMPVGIVAAITPFNFPLNLVAHKVAPAIAVGCPIVLKPNPLTPLTAIKLQSLAYEAGLPDGAFEVVTGDADVGNWLTTDDRIAMISFTGSPGVAKAISKVAGVRRSVFELGGNAACIIAQDADVEKAVARNVIGSFAYSGQVCISVQRLYVHGSQYEQFKNTFMEQTAKLTLGDPLSDDTDIGPMISKSASERVEAWVNEAVKQGATVTQGHERDGMMYTPTILENVTRDMRVMKDEIFGPVVNLIPYRDFDAALDAVNDSDYGLQAGVYTSDLSKTMRAIQRLDVGGVMINDVPTFRVDHMPYGGNKLSGVGREGPKFAIEDMTTLKMVVINS